MGKWFPGIRKGTPEQVKAYRQAKFDRDRRRTRSTR